MNVAKQLTPFTLENFPIRPIKKRSKNILTKKCTDHNAPAFLPQHPSPICRPFHPFYDQMKWEYTIFPLAREPRENTNPLLFELPQSA
jgi:hypothetical protein